MKEGPVICPGLEQDIEIHFPHFWVLKASAGSGKTRTLTERFVQFILSEKIPNNSLRNILAITFSNNAAKEMKERILLWLKAVYFGDPEVMDELSSLLTIGREAMTERAGNLITEILDSYSDFQVRTIDSFMTTVFKNSAIDFGYDPEFEIVMNGDSLMAYSFDFFLKEVRRGSEEAELIGNIIADIMKRKKSESAYLWEPSSVLLEEVKTIYDRLASIGKEVVIEDFSPEMSEIERRLCASIEKIENIINGANLQKRGNSSYISILPAIKEGRFADLIGRHTANPPANKPKNGSSQLSSFETVLVLWSEFSALLDLYTAYHVRSCHAPYLKLYRKFGKTVEFIKKRLGKIFIQDINWKLSEYLDDDIVPDVYFRIGEKIFHFLIDEFQDTSPIQWRNLKPLLENSLSQRGSAFIVGDTKQAIYGFRNADYTIMKEVEKRSPFPSARHMLSELAVNYRSLERILEFNCTVFKEAVAANAAYKTAAERSGLTDYNQRPREGLKEPGYVEVCVLERSDEQPPERLKIQELVPELLERGYHYRDIAILAQKNENVVRVTSWLNERDIPFISYSSLDIRRRRITGEIVSILSFLGSPTDDHAFTVFISGEVFLKNLSLDAHGAQNEKMREFLFSHRDDSALYKFFQEEFEPTWDTYFSGLFKASGYLPLYDLVCEVFRTFRLFDLFADEEAALVKILEVVKDFEGEGYNSLRDFLQFAGEVENGDPAWNISVPKDIDAVQVMTTHKSKGLGFPVVVALLYEDSNRGFDFIAQEDGDKVRLLTLTRDTAACHPVFASLYEFESTREKVNKLNSLYVAFTRPKEELYIIGVKGRGGYPFELLPAKLYAPADRPRRGVKEERVQKPECEIRHSGGEMKFHTAVDEMISAEERKRGEFIHKVLSCITYSVDGIEGELPSLLERAGFETGYDYNGADANIGAELVAFLRLPEACELFQPRPGRQIRNEQEFTDGSGNLFRMDRVIIDADEVTVADYKTGNDSRSDEKDMAQVKNYMGILREIYPGKAVRGVIAYIGRQELRRIS